MGERYCAICGTEIKPGARFCHGCGTPIEQVSAPADVNIKAPKKKSKAPLIITLSCIGGLIITAIVVLVLLICMKDDITLPYGLQPGMTLSECRSCMNENGFVDDFDYSGDYYYEATYQFGYKTDFSVLQYDYDFEYLEVVHFFVETGYNANNEGPKFTDIKEQLTKEYGRPEYDGTYRWIDGEYEIYIHYYSEGKFAVSYGWKEE